ncbi:MAG: hypothetical protein H0W08_01545 [Acidobacteria bacterium]|nr:hypothetical protein [Acidobacteriota bacterium]
MKFRTTSAFSIQHSAFLPAALFLLLALAWTWPLASRLSWRIPHDPGDPILNAWILWWNTQAVPFSDAWWNPPIFYPMPGAFGLSEHLAGIAVFTAPLHLAGVNSLAAYNVALIVSFWLSGYFAFLLARRLTGSTAAGLIAGVAFGFAPYRASQLSHLQVLTSQWMPLALLAMHAHLGDGRRRWLLLFAIAWLLQALSNGYYLLFFPSLVALWLLWFVDWKANRRRGLSLALTFAGSSLLLLPSLLRYQQIHAGLGLQRSLGEMMMFSAKPGSFIQPAYLLRFWPPVEAATQEGYLFPGATVIVLCLFGVTALIGRRQLVAACRSRSAGIFYGSSAVLGWWLCLGPAEEPSVPAVLVRPYTLLMWLPGFEGLRVPARFGMIATLCISIASACAAARLAPAVPWRRWLAAGIVAGGLFVDGWIEPMPLSAPPPRVMITAPSDAVVLELPADESSVGIGAMYRSMSHRRPIVNGYSGYTPPFYAVLTNFLRRGDPSILTYFATGRPLVVIVHRQLDPSGEWRDLVQQAGGVLQEESGLGPVFVIPPNARARTPPLGVALPASPVESEAGYAAIDLGSENLVRTISINLHWRDGEVGPQMTVETSSDGVGWVRVWENWIGGAALAAALRDHRMVPMRIDLPDVRARYLRVTPAPLWVSREMTAHGVR